jgi:hypothetical protein
LTLTNPSLAFRPKYLLAKGHDEEAIQVLYKIAKFNKAPTPNLTIEDFRLLEEQAASQTSMGSDEPLTATGHRPLTNKEQAKTVITRFIGQFKHLKGFFSTKRMIWLSLTLWIAYVRYNSILHPCSLALSGF